jgi:hypothetical protein
MPIAVYGASGYQGKLVMTELARRHLPAVLVGRDANRLEQAATEVGLAGAEAWLAAAGDHDRLVAAFRRCDAVVNCAGPFTPTGRGIVRAAIDAGCHYVDTAGEQLYIKAVFDASGPAAEQAGVTVVPAATDAGVPVDLVAHLLAERVPAIEELVVSHVIVGGGVSRGTLRSFQATREVFASGGLVYAGGDWRPAAAIRRAPVSVPGQDEPIGMVSLPLPEVVTIPRHVPVGHMDGLAEAALAASLSTPLTPEIIDAAPEGPTPDERRAQRFTYVIDAMAEHGISWTIEIADLPADRR